MIFLHPTSCPLFIEFTFIPVVFSSQNILIMPKAVISFYNQLLQIIPINCDDPATSIQRWTKISEEDASNSVLSNWWSLFTHRVICIPVFLRYLGSGLFFKPPLLIDSMNYSIIDPFSVSSIKACFIDLQTRTYFDRKNIAKRPLELLSPIG